MVIFNICFIASNSPTGDSQIIQVHLCTLFHLCLLALTVKGAKTGKKTEFHSFSKFPFTEKISENCLYIIIVNQEAVARRCSTKYVFLKTLQSLQQNICHGVSVDFWSLWSLSLLKRDSSSCVFLWILRNFFEHSFCRTPPSTASVNLG